MRKIQVPVDILRDCNKVRLVLVQLFSPFSEGPEGVELEVQNAYRNKGIFWTAERHVERRMLRVRLLLSQIQSKCFKDSTTRIVVFPEYAVPKECHEGLQDFANENNCIVIPGTYYEAEEPLHGNNVCKIFLPNQDPKTLVKEHGFREEAEVIQTDPDTPNIIDLLGGNEVHQRFSVSVSICRDYLTPYADISDEGSTCLLDLQNPGINLVVMCSSQTRLFEGRAALDVRDLPGPRRITALCNCAGTGIEGGPTIGSAIIGPQDDLDVTKGDIVKSLPGGREGVLQADIILDLPILAKIVVKPDTRMVVPVRHAQTYAFQNEGADVELLEHKETGPRERGVWLPEYLEHIQRCIVLHLFRTRHDERLNAAFSEYKIRNVSAFAIEGKQDTLIRYYRSVSGDADFRSLYCGLDDTAYKQIFVDDGHPIIVKPSDIIKYRTITIPQKSKNDDRSRERETIAQLVPKALNASRHTRLQRIGHLSVDWNSPKVSAEDRELLAPIFFKEHEYVDTFSIYESGRNVIREKFVLISSGATTSAKKTEFEIQIIFNRLAKANEVRSIYRIDTTLDDAHFDYWIDIVAEPWRIAEIVLGISAWGNRLDLETGTRTMEVLKFYVTDSVLGVHATDVSTEVRLFIDEARQRGAVLSDPDPIVQSFAFLRTCSTAWSQQTSSVEGPDELAVIGLLSKFYVGMFFGNVFSDETIRRNYRQEAANSWVNAYQKLEVLFDTMLRRYFNVEDTNRGAARRRAIARLDELKAPLRDSDRQSLGTSSAQCVFRLANHDNDFVFGPVVKSSNVSKIFEKVVKFRNEMSHEDPQQYLIIDQSNELKKPGERARDIVEATALLIEVGNLCNEIICVAPADTAAPKRPRT